MAYTFGDITRRVVTRFPRIPILLAEDMVRGAYNKCLNERSWSFLRRTGQISLAAARSGSVVVVHGDATIVGVGITFAAADVGAQFRSSSGKPYSIISVDLVGNTAELDQPYALGSTTVTGTVFTAYWSAPENFRHFLDVADPTNQRKLNFVMTQVELDTIDSARQAVGDPWAVVPLAPSTAAPGQMRYELWPYWTGTAARDFTMLYVVKHDDPTEDTNFIGPFAQAGEVVLDGALAEAAMWPGTADQPNIVSPRYADQKRKDYEFGLAKLEVQDEELCSTWLLNNYPIDRSTPGVYPIDARFMQSHE